MADFKDLSNFIYCNNIYTLPNKNIAEFTEVNLDPRLSPGRKKNYVVLLPVNRLRILNYYSINNYHKNNKTIFNQ